MKNFILATSVVLMFVLSSCAQETEQSNINETIRVERVSKTTFSENLNKGTIIDVRTPEEFANGHIEKAINIDFKNSNFQSEMEQFPKEELLLIYCHSGGRSGKALQLLKKAEFTNVLELEGGYSGWK